MAVYILTDPEFVFSTLVDYFSLRRIEFIKFRMSMGFTFLTWVCFTSELCFVNFVAFVAFPVLLIVFAKDTGRFRIRKLGHILNFDFFWLV